MVSHRFHGYAIVSMDDRIADASGAFPGALRNDADWTYFQAGLDKAAITVLGRRSHEAAPNAQRRRLVMSRTVARLLCDPNGVWWWNPSGASLDEALKSVAPEGGVVAVPGGQNIFDHITPAGFDVFHLARAHLCTLPGGRGLFSRCEYGVAAETLLEEGMLRSEPTRWLDEKAMVSLTLWRRPGLQKT